LPVVARIGGLVAAMLLYVWPNLPAPAAVKGSPIDTWAVGLGAAWAIVAIQAEDRLRRWSLGRIPTFLGDISYSLYLIHIPLLLALMFTLYGHIPTSMIAVIAIVVAVVAAAIVRALVEKPSIDLGRNLSRRLERRLSPQLSSTARQHASL
jgi:peptidoglycan/LPS O-acetylase OafA/YrhL